MGIIFITEHESCERVLMDCSRRWGERFVRMSDFIAAEYGQSSMFEEGGQIISDCVYIDLVKAQALFGL